MMREWMTTQMETNERMKNHVVELERKIKQGLRNHQAVIENLERQFEFLENKFLPRTTNTKPRHEFVYKPPSIRNENDKGDVRFIEEDAINPIPTKPKPNPIMSNSPTVPPFREDCTVHILYTNAKTFADDVFLNNIGDKKLKLIEKLLFTLVEATSIPIYAMLYGERKKFEESRYQKSISEFLIHKERAQQIARFGRTKHTTLYKYNGSE
ncbi:hypothetical protein Tco_1432877 [Tanacetum coccineum]